MGFVEVVDNPNRGSPREPGILCFQRVVSRSLQGRSFRAFKATYVRRDNNLDDGQLVSSTGAQGGLIFENANIAQHFLDYRLSTHARKIQYKTTSIRVIYLAHLLNLQSQAIILHISAPGKDRALVICRVEWQAQDHLVLTFFQKIRVERIFVRQCVAYHRGSGSA